MDIEKIISQMTLEEKCSLLSGEDFWHTQTIERLGIEPVMVSDGPNGLRKQDQSADNGNENTSIKSVCMPSACATAASFDRELLYKEGRAIGESCKHEQVGVVLGPALNIKRSPLCGRNFEYYSEDPYLAGEMASALIRGIQSRGVGACAKHFAGNNQERRRLTVDSCIDERTLREIYLPAFEACVKNANVWTMMCSYNRVNGVHSAQNKKLLTDILRDEWGFDGYVMSDWGAVEDRTEGVRAGLDLQMPGNGGEDDRKVVEDVRSGKLDEALVDTCIRRILSVGQRVDFSGTEEAAWDQEKDHELAADIAAECMVLLKNDEDILPIRKGEKVAFLGEFVEKTRHQGGGSSHVNSRKITSLLDALAETAGVTYARGYRIAEEAPNEALIAEAVEIARKADKAVIVAGLPDSYESEGYDRTHLRIPACQVELIRRVAQANPNTVVVLCNGSPIEMPWLNCAKGVLEAYLAGENAGEAIRRILYGEAIPSGRLPETFPIRLEDTPCFFTYDAPGDKAIYSEGVFAGYRGYDKRKTDVLFPFGYGLSYTRFEYSNLRLSADRIAKGDTLHVSVDVTNVGDVAAKEVVQLYVGAADCGVLRPIRELRGFEKILLCAGETKTVEFDLNDRAFAYWNTSADDWYVESGSYTIEICKNSREVVLSAEVSMESTDGIEGVVTLESVYEDLRRYKVITPKMKALLDKMEELFISHSDDESSKEAITPEMERAMLDEMPLRGVVTLGARGVDYSEILEAIDEMNANRI